GGGHRSAHYTERVSRASRPAPARALGPAALRAPRAPAFRAPRRAARALGPAAHVGAQPTRGQAGLDRQRRGAASGSPRGGRFRTPPPRAPPRRAPPQP